MQLQQLRNQQPYRSLTAEYPEATIADAYLMQRAFVAALAEAGDWGQIVGYKAALTAPQAQQMMGTSKPVIGVLFSGGERSPEPAVTIDRPVMLETELGFRLNAAVTAPLSVAAVTGHVAAVLPVLELAAPNLATRPNAPDLIASNSATYGFIPGADQSARGQQSAGAADLDTLMVALAHDDIVLHSEAAGSIMQGQWQALTWLISEVLEQGYALRQDHLLITGSIGALHAGKPGKYRAQYGQLGAIEFVL
ncbi:MAG: hypothetical protein CBC52_010045 [Gammaproteobacteria bacterium TMED92]|nr:MAG: hypothetical protein CBC52_010045 [Gammaproteobacteria bacterium TMED92]